jgi:hypothetical protein
MFMDAIDSIRFGIGVLMVLVSFLKNGPLGMLTPSLRRYWGSEVEG